MQVENDTPVTRSLHTEHDPGQKPKSADSSRCGRHGPLLLLALALVGCGPGGWEGGDGDTGDSSRTDTGTEETAGEAGDGDGDPGDGDGDLGSCAGELPHDWAEGLVDVWLHTCEAEGTTVTCCVAAWVGDEHQGVVTPYSATGSNWWSTPPLFADAGELVGPWWSDGSTRYGQVSWDHCGLPRDDLDPAMRTFELRILDYALGATATDSVTMGAGSIVCPDEEPCEGQTSLECDDSGCWASSPGWTGEAQAITQASIDQAVDAGLWVPAELGAGDACWTVASSDAHICVVESCGVMLMGRPSNELQLGFASPGCSYTGSWSSTASGLGMCLGTIDGLSVQLRP
jgi:hypothetical protein